MKTRILVVGIVSLGVLMGALVLLLPRATATTQVAPATWPAFTMTFTEWRYGLGYNGAPGTQQSRFIYRDAQHWRTETRANSTVPEMVGEWSEYDGKTIRGFNPQSGAISVNDVSGEQGVYIPAEWLRPDYIIRQLKKATTTEQLMSTPGQKALTTTETVPCSGETVVAQAAGLRPCTGNGRTTSRTITYQAQHFIPLQIVDTVDGVVMQRITIEDLQIEAK